MERYPDLTGRAIGDRLRRENNRILMDDVPKRKREVLED